jgi:hypothetical protein
VRHTAVALAKTFRASLTLLPGGLADTAEGAWRGTDSVRGTPKRAPDLDFSTEAARRIELLYRALQALA